MKQTFIKLNNFLNHHELILLLLFFTLVLRLPSLFEPLWYGDENIYLSIGQGIRKGLVLYTDITDFPNKPPMIYLIAAAVRGVFGFRLILLFWQMIGTAFSYLLAQKILANKTTAFFSALIFLFLNSTPLIEGSIANAENFFIVPTIIAVWLLYPSPTDNSKFSNLNHTKVFLAGLSLGFAFLFKIHVALDILAIGLFFFVLAPLIKFTHIPKLFINKSLWTLVLGLAIPIIAVLAIWTSMGVPAQSLFLNAAGSSGYVSIFQSQDILAQTIGFGSLPARIIGFGIILLGLFTLRNKFQKNSLFISLWLFSALFAVLLSARPYPHYLLQLTPPLALALGLFFVHKSIKNHTLIALTLLVTAAAYLRFDFSTWQVTAYYNNFISYSIGKIDRTEFYRRFDSRMPVNYQLGQYLRQVTKPDEKIYIWGTEPGVYVLADRLPVGKLVVSFHVADLDYFDETITALRDEKPPVIVVMEREWRNFPQLNLLLDEQYLLTKTITDPTTSHDQAKGRRAFVYRRFNKSS